MRYENIVSGRFISRPNRFIAHVEMGGREEICHVINTGRMRELLLPGAEVFLCESKNHDRKTKFDLIAVRRGDEIVNIDSLAPNRVAGEYIPTMFPGCKTVKPETFYGKSRFDFYIETAEEKIFLEVKGVTLNRGGAALFPDAPTERGAKHLYELSAAKAEGFRAAILFVIAMKGVSSFSPNAATDPKFAAALSFAKNSGVEIYAIDCDVSESSIVPGKPIPIKLL